MTCLDRSDAQTFFPLVQDPRTPLRPRHSLLVPFLATPPPHLSIPAAPGGIIQLLLLGRCLSRFYPLLRPLPFHPLVPIYHLSANNGRFISSSPARLYATPRLRIPSPTCVSVTAMSYPAASWHPIRFVTSPPQSRRLHPVHPQRACSEGLARRLYSTPAHGPDMCPLWDISFPYMAPLVLPPDPASAASETPVSGAKRMLAPSRRAAASEPSPDATVAACTYAYACAPSLR